MSANRKRGCRNRARGLLPPPAHHNAQNERSVTMIHGLTVEQLECAHGWTRGAELVDEGRQMLSLSDATQASRAARLVARVGEEAADASPFADGLRAALAARGWPRVKSQPLAVRAPVEVSRG